MMTLLTQKRVRLLTAMFATMLIKNPHISLACTSGQLLNPETCSCGCNLTNTYCTTTSNNTLYGVLPDCSCGCLPSLTLYCASHYGAFWAAEGSSCSTWGWGRAVCCFVDHAPPPFVRFSCPGWTVQNANAPSPMPNVKQLWAAHTKLTPRLVVVPVVACLEEI